ncbi:MAG TPA: type II toxin-antitoxin system prevent-host-death family antitoxin [Caulobacteraceae bacterium]|jgi:prevent-host-death family protein|nr:type II toxin-antitoxin system prevent-host-death family antitoxin [Caulobacteraceae bacterium]
MEVGVFEAKARLSDLLARVERGEEVVITRRGAPVAKLSSLSRRPSRIDLERIFAEAAAARRALPKTDWNAMKRDRDVGRR